MDIAFMEEYYERFRADDIEALSAARISDYTKNAEKCKSAVEELVDALGLQSLFDHQGKLSKEEKALWQKFDHVDVAFLLHTCALMKGAYLLGAEDRERMLR